MITRRTTTTTAPAPSTTDTNPLAHPRTPLHCRRGLWSIGAGVLLALTISFSPSGTLSVFAALDTTDTATGSGALAAENGGTFNTADGNYALTANTTGYENTASGSAALTANTTGNTDTATGQGTLFSNTTGSRNTASGTQALFSNTIGGYNTASGTAALFSNTTGSGNTAAGDSALSHANGFSNTADGSLALLSTTSGSHDTGLGYGAGNSDGSNANTTGSDDTFVGYETGPSTSSEIDNATAIGANAEVGESNALVLGGSGKNAVLVGIGTAAPDDILTVVGQVESTTGGYKFPDGSVQLTASTVTTAPGSTGSFLRSNGSSWVSSGIQVSDIPAGSPSYIGNSNGGKQQSSASFNIDGDGTLGGALTVGGNAVLGANSANTVVQIGKPSKTYGSYLQLPLVTNKLAPPAAQCNATTFVGRVVIQYNPVTTASTIWTCSSAGKWSVTN